MKASERWPGRPGRFSFSAPRVLPSGRRLWVPLLALPALTSQWPARVGDRGTHTGSIAFPTLASPIPRSSTLPSSLAPIS